MRILAMLGLALCTLPANAETIALDCTFLRACGAAMDCAAADLSLAYLVDREAQSVVLLTQAGHVGVTVVQGEGAISFFEYLETGGIQATTFTAGGAAVHSRHIVIDGKLAPSQFYGTCTERRVE